VLPRRGARTAAAVYLRIDFGEHGALGPDKVCLMELIAWLDLPPPVGLVRLRRSCGSGCRAPSPTRNNTARRSKHLPKASSLLALFCHHFRLANDHVGANFRRAICRNTSRLAAGKHAGRASIATWLGPQLAVGLQKLLA
jgi:hypothetical protein